MHKQVARNLIWCGVIAAVIAGTALPAAHRAWRGHTGDFTHFWQAAHAMLHGDDIYAAAAGRYVYPPLLAFLFQPLALISERAAAIVWIAINSGLVLAAVLIAAKEVSARWQIKNALLITAVALILNVDKVRSLLNLGQSDGLMILALAGVLVWMERRPLLAGLAVGLSANIKYVSLIFVPYFLIKRNYRAAIAAALSFGFFMFLPAVEVGLGRGLEYVRAAIGGLMKMFGLRSTSTSADIFDVAWNRSVSITSTLFRFTHSHQWPDWPALLGAFFLFAAIIAVVIAICRARGVAIFQPRAEPGARMATLEWATLIVLALVFSPQTTARHMVLMSLVYVVAVAVLLAQREKQSKIILIAAIAFMVGALTLPFGNSASQAVWTWREIGGASWCAILFLLALVWIGSLAARQHVDLSGDKITPDPDPSSRSRP